MAAASMAETMPDRLRTGSLFAGIGGFDLGLERTCHFRTVWLAERDGYRRRVLARHWPHARLFRDVHHVSAKTAGPVDVLCGGFPCQDLSDAGKQRGIGGARSGLWSEFHRCVAEFRPSWVLIENVSSLARRGLATVLRDLAALRYDAEWADISAADVGAPHPRDRLWIAAYPAADADQDRRDDQRGAQAHDEGQARARLGAPGQRRGPRASRSGGGARDGGPEPAVARIFTAELWQDVADAKSQRGAPDWWRGDIHVPADTGDEGARPRHVPERGGQRSRASSWPAAWQAEPDVGRVADGIPARVDRVAALGDALVPIIPAILGRSIVRAHYGEQAA